MQVVLLKDLKQESKMRLVLGVLSGPWVLLSTEIDVEWMSDSHRTLFPFFILPINHSFIGPWGWDNIPAQMSKYVGSRVGWVLDHSRIAPAIKYLMDSWELSWNLSLFGNLEPLSDLNKQIVTHE